MLIHPDIEKIVYSEEEINNRVKELGQVITIDYKEKKPLFITVLKGGVFFLTDLLREVKLDMMVDYIAISNYGSSSEKLGVVRVLKDLDQSIEGIDIIVVEDVIDTGLTLNYLLKNLKNRHPKSIKVCTLLDKSVRRIADLKIDYKGFDIPDIFVVGYGLDFKQKYRNLPYIGILKADVRGNSKNKT